MKSANMLGYWSMIVLALFASLAAQGAPITWNNTAGGNWSVASNWTPAQVPGSGDTALITNTAASYTVTLDVAATVGGLVVGGASGAKTLTLNQSSYELTLQGAAIVAPSGVLDIGSGGMSISAPLTNNGTVNWQAGAITLANDGTANNTGLIWNAGQWNITTSQALYSYGVAADDFFYNRGTLRMNEANGTMTIEPYLDNTGGMVVAQAGTITFNSGSNLAGSFQAATGAGIQFSGGTLNWSGTANFSGNVQITGGRVNVTASVTSLAAAGVTITGLSNIVSGAYLTNCTIADAERVVGKVYWAGGTIFNSASLTVASAGTLTLVANSGNSPLNIQGPFTNNGTVNWSGGQLVIDNNSGVSWSGGIWNAGTWNIQGASLNLSADGGGGYSGYEFFHNSGTLTANSASYSLYSQVYLDNKGGSVEAEGGTLTFGAGSNLGGSFQASSGGAIVFSGGIINWNGTANFSGNVQITGGTVNVTASVTSLAAAGVTITGLSNIVSGAYLTNCTIADAEQISGTVNLAGGLVANAGSLTVAGSGQLNLIPSNYGFSINGPLTNNGTVNWSGGSVAINNAATSYSGVIWNAGVWTIQSAVELGADSGSGFSGYEFFQNTGSLVISSSGTVSFQPKLVNAGTVDVETGALSLVAGATWESNGTVEFGINSLTSYGSISLTGSAALAGKLSAHLNGGYVPTAVGNTFPVVTYGSKTGTFTITNLPAVAVWQPTYGATALNLAVVKLVPQMTWAKPANIVYGTALGASQLNATFASPVSGGTNITGTFTYTPASGTVLDWGSNQTLTVKFTPKDLTDFTNVTDTQTITVTKAPMSVTANSTSKTYGQTVTFAGTEFGTSGLVNGDTVTSATLASPGAAPTALVSGSPYTITITNAAGDGGLTNYNITYVSGMLTISKAALTVTANAESKTYGQTVTFGSGSALFASTGLENGETIGSVTLAVSGNGGAGTATVAGSPYTITASAATGGTFNTGNYTITYETGLLTVNKASLTVTATGPAMTYGTALTAGSSMANFTTSGLVNGEVVSSVTLTPNSAGLSATTAAGASYTVTPSAATGTGTFATGNYNITYTAYNGTVAQAPLTITAKAQSKTYGTTQTFGSGSAQFTSSGLKNSDAISTVTITDTDDGGAATAPVGGTYALTPSAPVFSTGTQANYTNTYSTGRLSVTKATPTVTVTVGAYTYTGQPQGPEAVTFSTPADTGAVIWSYAGTGGTTYAANATPPTAAGTYTATAAVAADNNNNAASSTATAFTIAKATPAVTVTGATTFTYNGLSQGPGTSTNSTPDTGAVTYSYAGVSGTVYTASATPPKAVGSYTVTASVAADANNNAASSSATAFAIAKATLMITANDRSKTYGQALTFSSGSTQFTPTGLQNGDTIGSVTLTCSGGPANAAVSGSPYTITPSLPTGGTFNIANYNPNYVAGQLMVSTLGVTLTGTRVYDGTTNAAALILTISDVVSGDAGKVTLAGTAGLASASVGTPSITSFGGLTLNGSAAGNYTLAGASGSVSISKATPTVTIAGTTSFTYNGLSQGPAAATVTPTDTGAVTYSYAGSGGTTYAASTTPPAAAGNYTVTATVAADANNNSAPSSATPFAIGQAAVTVTASAQSKTYGQTVAFGSASTNFIATGLLNGDTIGTVTLAVTGNGGAGTASVAGSPYTINPTAATGGTFTPGNYSITYAPGSLTVNPAVLSIMADNTNKYAGETLTFAGTEFTANGLQNGETIGTVTLTSPGTAASAAAGAYAITPGAPTGGTFSLGNYLPAFVNGTLTVSTTPELTLAEVGNQYVLTFPTLLGQSYQVQSSTNLAAGNWSALGSALAGTGGALSVTNPVTGPPAFFQLFITP